MIDYFEFEVLVTNNFSRNQCFIDSQKIKIAYILFLSTIIHKL